MPSVPAARGMDRNMDRDECRKCGAKPNRLEIAKLLAFGNAVGKDLRERFGGAELGIKLLQRQVFGKAMLMQLLLQTREKGLTNSPPAGKPTADPGTVLPNDAITHGSYPLTRF